ncbi:MAG: MurR/RpiR family transcriptional regulator [Actinomycetia bacterium]|nr:MurR/RpiR family transcriptional regulator [Actinomycetes bacterium]
MIVNGSNDATNGPLDGAALAQRPGGAAAMAELDPSSAAPLTVVIRGRVAGLQPAMRRVGEYIVAHPADIAGMTISDLAGACHTSETTIVRFCREIGLRGYSQFRLALASEMGGRSRDQLCEPDSDIVEGDTLETVVRKIVAVDRQAVVQTGETLSVAELQAVVDAVAAARRIEIYGVGASYFVAADLAIKLHRIGMVSYSSPDPHASLASAALMTGDDVAIAISHSGLTIDTYDALSIARANGAATVAITNAPGSPIALAADHVLTTAARETAFRSGANASRLAQLTVVDCLFVGVAQRTYADATQALRVTRDAVDGRRLPARPTRRRK